jgi:dCMP deaminase
MRITREQMLMEIAFTVAKRGTCGRLQVGAVIARDSRVISMGYVGPPSGEPHCEEFGCDLTKPCRRTIHAERNAIEFAWRQELPIKGADMFCTDSPCPICTELLLYAGIARLYFRRPYRVFDHLRNLDQLKVIHLVD